MRFAKVKWLWWRSLVAVMPLLLAACATTSGIALVEDSGRLLNLSPLEVEELSGGDLPYLIQVGDDLQLDFKTRTLRAGELPTEYRIEIGDNLDVRVSPEHGIENYLIDVGDVIGVSFLTNWQLNVTRTVRPDGYISLSGIGDVKISGKTAEQVTRSLEDLYAKSGIVQGDPQITVNVDFVNLDRLENLSAMVVVRPDGAVHLPGLKEGVLVAQLTLSEAAQAIRDLCAQKLSNPPLVSVIYIPYDNTDLMSMNTIYRVRPDGAISVSRLGQLQMAGLTVEEAQRNLSKATQGVLYNPVEVAVNVANSTGARIYVGGEVEMPGVYPLTSTPTALQAIVMANGAMNTARLKQVLVMRRNPQGKPFLFTLNLAKTLKKGYTENDIALRPHDVVYLPKKHISKANLFVEQYINQLVPFDNQLGFTGTYFMNEQKVNTKNSTRTYNFNTGITGITDVIK